MTHITALIKALKAKTGSKFKGITYSKIKSKK